MWQRVPSGNGTIPQAGSFQSSNTCQFAHKRSTLHRCTPHHILSYTILRHVNIISLGTPFRSAPWELSRVETPVQCVQKEALQTYHSYERNQRMRDVQAHISEARPVIHKPIGPYLRFELACTRNVNERKQQVFIES